MVKLYARFFDHKGLFYWVLKGTSHYGRFTAIERPSRIQHTWVSPNRMGEESTVTVMFKTQGENTLMTLVHSDLPDTDAGSGHERDWNYFLGFFLEQFSSLETAHASESAGKAGKKLMRV